MSKVAKNGMPSPSPDGSGNHDVIRVHGARENNLKDVSIEIPKRRLTVFTGVSGSGKSSLVFDTIAAESQRLTNETYSAFVQGVMPTLARPEVGRSTPEPHATAWSDECVLPVWSSANVEVRTFSPGRYLAVVGGLERGARGAQRPGPGTKGVSDGQPRAGARCEWTTTGMCWQP